MTEIHRPENKQVLAFRYTLLQRHEDSRKTLTLDNLILQKDLPPWQKREKHNASTWKYLAFAQLKATADIKSIIWWTTWLVLWREGFSHRPEGNPHLEEGRDATNTFTRKKNCTLNYSMWTRFHRLRITKVTYKKQFGFNVNVFYFTCLVVQVGQKSTCPKKIFTFISGYQVTTGLKLIARLILINNKINESEGAGIGIVRILLIHFYWYSLSVWLFVNTLISSFSLLIIAF